MIHVPEPLLGREVELRRVTVTAEMVAEYARTVGDEYTAAAGAPPTFCLALRGGMTPEVTLPPDMFGVYGGHDLEFHKPIRTGETYRITGRIADVFEKIGRSGTLTVVVREASIYDGGGHTAARIVERQIVRKRPEAAGKVREHALRSASGHASRASARAVSEFISFGTEENSGRPSEGTPSFRGNLEGPSDRLPTSEADETGLLDLGHELGPRHRATPDAEQITRYAGAEGIVEPLFTSASAARALGYRGVVVPGPMLAAFLEQFVRRELTGWRLERLSTTFRVPTITGDAIILRGVITERHELPDGEHIVCDLLIEHSDGERAVTGAATLRRQP